MEEGIEEGLVLLRLESLDHSTNRGRDLAAKWAGRRIIGFFGSRLIGATLARLRGVVCTSGVVGPRAGGSSSVTTAARGTFVLGLHRDTRERDSQGNDQ